MKKPPPISRDHLCRVHDRLTRIGRLPMWVVYRPVHDYRDKWVARMHVTLPAARPTRWLMAHDTLEQLRTLLPPGMVRLDRDPGDVPEIVELWL